MPRRTDELVRQAASYLNTDPNRAKLHLEEILVIMGNPVDTKQFVYRICPEQSASLLRLIGVES